MPPRKPAPGTAPLDFDATLVKVAPTMAKASPYGYGEPTAGALEVTFRIAQPTPPAPVKVPYELTANNVSAVGATIKKRPTKLTKAQWPTRPADMTDEQYEALKAEMLTMLQERYDRSLAAYDTQVQQYERALAAAAPRLMQYAQLVGLSALLGNTEVSVTVAPKHQTALAGFFEGSIVLRELPPPAPEDDDIDPEDMDDE